MAAPAQVPQVVGYPYLVALDLVRGSGCQSVRLRLTRPPRAFAGLGQLRVVQQHVRSDAVSLVVAYENYEERPRRAQ